MVAALAADAHEITASITALGHNERAVGAGDYEGGWRSTCGCPESQSRRRHPMSRPSIGWDSQVASESCICDFPSVTFASVRWPPHVRTIATGSYRSAWRKSWWVY